MQNRLLFVDDERMTRVVSALKADDRARAIREHVDDGALALVAPLRPDDDYVSTHATLARCRAEPSPRSRPQDRTNGGALPRATQARRDCVASAAAPEMGTTLRAPNTKPDPQKDPPRPKPQASVVNL